MSDHLKLPSGVPLSIGEADRFRCPHCGTVSNYLGEVLEGPLVSSVLPTPPEVLTDPQRRREQRNQAGVLLAELCVFTADTTSVSMLRERIQAAVTALDEIYSVPCEGTATQKRSST